MSPQANRTLHSQANAETRYFVKKKTLLALSKLTVLSSDLPEDELDKQVDGKKEKKKKLSSLCSLSLDKQSGCDFVSLIRTETKR